MSEEFPCCECCESDPYHPDFHTIDCPTCDGHKFTPRELIAHDREVAVKTLREAVFALRRAFEGSWNLRDPHDPEVSYSVDRWLEVRADRLDGVDSGRGL